jgi:hypothetical protein
MVRLNRPEETVSETIILGQGAAAAPAVIELLKELGLWSEGNSKQEVGA